MLNDDRLTAMSQYGEILYIGKYKKGDYKGYGDFSYSPITTEAVEEILYKLYILEETIDDLKDKLKRAKEREY